MNLGLNAISQTSAAHPSHYHKAIGCHDQSGRWLQAVGVAHGRKVPGESGVTLMRLTHRYVSESTAIHQEVRRSYHDPPTAMLLVEQIRKFRPPLGHPLAGDTG